MLFQRTLFFCRQILLMVISVEIDATTSSPSHTHRHTHTHIRNNSVILLQKLLQILSDSRYAI